jgi:hypothetical protein
VLLAVFLAQMGTAPLVPQQDGKASEAGLGPISVGWRPLGSAQVQFRGTQRAFEEQPWQVWHLLGGCVISTSLRSALAGNSNLVEQMEIAQAWV